MKRDGLAPAIRREKARTPKNGKNEKRLARKGKHQLPAIAKKIIQSIIDTVVFQELFVTLGTPTDDRANMRFYTMVPFLVLAAIPMPLFAQMASSAGSASSGQSASGQSNDLGIDVQNVSEQASSRGEFIGSGRPTYFVGIDEVFSSTPARSTTNSAARRQTTPQRSTVRSSTAAAQRRTGMMSGISQSGNANTQGIRSISTFDLNAMTTLSQRPNQKVVEANLARIQGIQEGQITFTHSPTETTAVLTGTVASERERKVAQQILLLEPGINRVENLLEIRW